MENLNIALIGCGMIGREHIERIQNRIRNARIVAVCDVFEEGAKKGAEIAGAGTKVYTDFNEAINDPDVNAVVVTMIYLTLLPIHELSYLPFNLSSEQPLTSAAPNHFLNAFRLYF